MVYSKRSCIQADAVHRFDVLGELLPGDLDVLKNSIRIFFNQLQKSETESPIVVLDLSESTIKTNELKLQDFIAEMKTEALASQIFMSIAQSDIESMHAEQKAVEASLLSKINLLKNKLDMMDSINQQIGELRAENAILREKISIKKTNDTGKKQARTIFEKLWGET